MVRFLLMVISVGYIGASAVAWQFPYWYMSELWLSFVPYWIWGGIGLGILMLLFCMFMKSRILKKILVLLAIFVFLCAGWYGKKYWDFYGSDILSGVSEDVGSGGLSLLYANIWYKNPHMEELYQTIIQEDPDVILLVEYTPSQHEILYPLLQKQYPHVTTDYPGEGIGGKVVYAKYPFTNLAPTLEGDARWKYGYVSMTYKGKEYVLYTVHTSAPVSPVFLEMRNRQLAQLGADITAHTERKMYDSRVLIVGDFNVSPWSPAYTVLEESLGKRFTNILHAMPGIMTWTLFGSAGLVGSTIDHVWTTAPDDVQEMKSVDIPGSDHKGWWVLID